MSKIRNISLVLNSEVIDQLDLSEQETVNAVLDGDQLIIQKQEEYVTRELSSWTFYLALFLANIIFGLVVHSRGMQQIPLTGDYSITGFLFVLGGLLSLFFFSLHFILNRTRFLGNLKRRLFWRILPIMILSFIAIVSVALIGFSWLLGQLFSGASFDRITSAIIFSVMTYALILAVSQIAKQMKSTWLTAIFTVVIVTGVLISMATNSSRQWWQFNVSFLGTDSARASWQFNLTLILSGLILVALIDYLFVALSQGFGKSWRLNSLRALLTLLGLDLALVGYFPNNASSHDIHKDAAGYLVYIIIVLILAVKWLLPNVSKDFLITSYVIGGVLVLLEFAFRGLHYLSLTAFEMSAFILAFTWVILLLNRLQSLVIPEKRSISLSLTKSK